MSELKEKLDEIMEKPLEKIILSNASKAEYKKIVLTKEKDTYAAEKFTDKQAFHERIPVGQIGCFCRECMETGFKQLNAFSGEEEYSIKVSKKGKVLSHASKNKNKVKMKSTDAHRKNYYLAEGEVIPPLVDMGVFTKEGKVVASMYDKYRQINKFIQFIDEAVDKSGLTSLNIIDFGCDKSYLTFIVYYYLTFKKGLDVTMTGMDLKADAIRANLLTYCGYKTQLLEFIDFSHTPKNIMIRAVRSNISSEHKAQMLEEVETLMKTYHLDPTLYRKLQEAGIIKQSEVM